MKDIYPRATITPFRTTRRESARYKVEVDGSQPYMWANVGDYDTPEAAIGSFTPPLCIEYQREALQVLRDCKTVTFSLDGALCL